jgi:hypothetical protein
MRTALDADASAMDEHEKKFVSTIRKHGWTQTSVSADEAGCGFSYTTGFWLNLRFPELITFSLRHESAHDTFWYMYRELEGGQTFAVREPIENIFSNLRATLLPVPGRHFQEYLGWSRWFYGGDDFSCMQLVWPDPSGKFPWQFDVSSAMLDAQPDLTDGNWSGLRHH